MTITFDGGDAPTEKRGAEFPKLELQKGEVARINILSTKGWAATLRHYVQNVGYIHCHAMKNAKSVKDLLQIEDEGGRPEDCPLCQMLSEGNTRIKLPQRRFAIRVLRYKTDLDGRPSPGGLKYWMEIWILGNRKYWRLQEIVKEWGDDKGRIAGHDLTLTCEDEQYQNMSLGVKKDALWTSAHKEIKEYFKEEAKKYDLKACLGQTMDEEALKRRFMTMERKERMRAGVDREGEEEEIGSASVAEKVDDIFDDEEEGKEESKGEIPAVDASDDKELDFVDDL